MRIVQTLAALLSLLGAAMHSATAQSSQPTATDAANEPRIVANQTHASRVLEISISRDARLMASVGGEETAKLWDVATGRLLRSFYGGLRANLSRVALSPDGLYLAAASSEGTLAIWNTLDGREIVMETGQDSDVHWLRWSPDGRFFVAGGHAKRGDDNSFFVAVSESARLHDPVDRGFVRDFQANVLGETTASFVGDSSRIAFAYSSGGQSKVALWDVAADVEPTTVSAPSERLATGRSAVIGVINFKAVDLLDSAGRPLRTTEPHSDYLGNLAFSGDGKTIIGVDYKSTLIAWDVASGKRISTTPLPKGTPVLNGGVAPIDDGRLFLAAASTEIHVRDLKTGQVTRRIGEKVDRVFAVTPLVDPRQVLAGGVGTLAGWDIVAGRHVRRLDVGEGGLNSVKPTADGKKLLLGYSRRLMRLIDTDTGRETARISDTARPLAPERLKDPIGRPVWEATANVNSMSFTYALSSDGKVVAHGRNDGLIRVFSTADAPKLMASLDKAHGGTGNSPQEGDPITALAVSPDGSLLASGGIDYKARLWDARSLRVVKELAGHTWSVMSLAFETDGRHVITGSGDRSIMRWNVATGQHVWRSSAHDGVVKALAVSADGQLLVSGGSEGAVKVWTIADGKLRHALSGHVGEVTSVGWSRDGRRVLSGGDDGTFKVWDSQSGMLLASFIAAANGEWLVMTPDGFFASSPAGGTILSIVRGHQVITIDQVHQSLYNPDLVREALAGDPSGEVKAAAAVINMRKVLESGPAPRVALTTTSTSPVTTEAVTVTAQISDLGKGIGRIEWRVNGITAAVTPPPAAKDRVVTLKQTLAIDSGDNVIEVTAYNATNVLASAAARIVIKATPQKQAAKPRLHILAIGINAYTDRGWIPPGQKEPVSFGALNLAVKDARAFSEEMRKAAAGLYADVRVAVLTDEQATRDNLEKSVANFTSGIDRHDTFILFAAAHGYSHDNKFYLIPSDHQGGTDPAALASRAIGQDRLQAWLTTGLKARKALVLLDTCESGALISGHRRSRLDSGASDAAVGRLHETTGRPVLAAAAQGQFAHEGVVSENGGTHGVFTWALIGALRKADRNGNGVIEVSEIVAYVQDEVPKLAAKLGGLARTATPIEPVFGEQSARFGSRGEDFTLVRRLN